MLVAAHSSAGFRVRVVRQCGSYRIVLCGQGLGGLMIHENLVVALQGTQSRITVFLSFHVIQSESKRQLCANTTVHLLWGCRLVAWCPPA